MTIGMKVEMEKSDLITGATGFIGQHLARRLIREGRNVKLLCRKDSEKKLPKELTSKATVCFGDLQERDSLLNATQDVDRVFHCAGQVSDWGSPKDFFSMNVQGTSWLLEGSLNAGVRRFVHLSSIAAFGTPAPSYFDDESPYGSSKDFYSQSKVEGEKAVFAYFHEKKLPTTILRPAVVYGPQGTWLEEPLQMIEKNKMFLLGGGVGTCHPCYIENLVDAILLAAEHPNAVGQGYIVADGESIPFREYFNSLAWIAGKPPIQRSIPLAAAKLLATACENTAKLTRTSQRPLLTHTALRMVTTESRMSVKKIQNELGFQPRYNFKSAIQELRKWYLDRSTFNTQSGTDSTH